MDSQTVADLLSRIPISEVYRRLGGNQPRRGRATAFWRNGDGESVALHDKKNTWFDFVSNRGGGVLDMIREVRGGSRRDALLWLAAELGIPLEERRWTAAERRGWAVRRAAAEPDALALLGWRDELIAALRARRNQLLHVYHASRRFLRDHVYEDCERRGDWRWELAFDIQYDYWPRIEELDSQIAEIETASMSLLFEQFKNGTYTKSGDRP